MSIRSTGGAETTANKALRAVEALEARVAELERARELYQPPSRDTLNKGVVTCDSGVYRAGFYGILNKQGDFWTPLAFDSEVKAWQHMRDFWGNQRDSLEECLRTHKVVPVRIRLETIPARAQAGEKS